MIKDLINEINSVINKNRILLNQGILFIPYLIHLKYLCEENIYSFDEVIANDQLYPLTKESLRFIKHNSNTKTPINRILLSIKHMSSKEILLEYLEYLDKHLYLHDVNDNIAYLNIESNIYSYYNKNGNVTYIMRFPEYYETFKVFDKILEIDNKYVSLKDIENDLNNYNYDYIYIYDNSFRFSKSSDNLLETINKFLNITNNIVLMARYSKISNFREGRFLSRYIKTIVLDNKQAIMHFQKKKDNDNITIINTDNIEDKSKLLSIIKNNRKQKDVLIKITLQDLRDNNYRIGFNLYNLEKANKIKDINKIVDENTYYLERLNRINQTVEEEINRLLNR